MEKVVKVTDDAIMFTNGYSLESSHERDCCEHHYLSFEHLTLDEFEGLEFDLTGDNFFRKIEDYGIELVPLRGHSVRIPGYGINNGYYSSNLTLELSKDNKTFKTFDISECQVIHD